MHKTLAPLALALALAALSGSAALATEIQQGAPPASPTRPSPEARQQRQLASMMQRYERLSLTEDQKNQIRPLLKAQLDELRDVRMDTNLADETRQLRAKAIVDGYRERIASVLTAEQKAQLTTQREANIKAARGAGTVTRRGRPVDDNN